MKQIFAPILAVFVVLATSPDLEALTALGADPAAPQRTSRSYGGSSQRSTSRGTTRSAPSRSRSVSPQRSSRSISPQRSTSRGTTRSVQRSAPSRSSPTTRSSTPRSSGRSTYVPRSSSSRSSSVTRSVGSPSSRYQPGRSSRSTTIYSGSTGTSSVPRSSSSRSTSTSLYTRRSSSSAAPSATTPGSARTSTAGTPTTPANPSAPSTAGGRSAQTAPTYRAPSSRVRFPAPAYSSSLRGRSVLPRLPRTGGSEGQGSTSSSADRGGKLSRRGQEPGVTSRSVRPAPQARGNRGNSTSVVPGKSGSGRRVRYGSGPLERLAKPNRGLTTRGVGDTRPSTPDHPFPTAGGVRGSATSLDAGSARVSLRRGASYPPPTGTIGSGVVGSHYRGYGGIHHGVYNLFGTCYSWGWRWYGGFYNPCWWGSWPYYFACYFPYLYYYYVPYFRTVYVQEQPVRETTTVVYVNGGSGEGVVPEPADDRLPIAAERYLTLGDRAFREGRYTDAVQFYAKAVEYAPDQGGLFLVLSDALFAAGDYHYAAYAIRRAFQLEPELAQATVDKRTFYTDPADFDAQLASLEGYLATHPTDRDARVVLALNYHFTGRPEEAVSTLAGGAGLEEDPAAQAMLATLNR